MILFLGMAGSGKSKQGRMLADELGLPWLSTGEFLRMLLSGERRRQMVTGKLLPDSEIIRLIQKIFQLINTDEDFILDGFPRSEQQVDWLLNQVSHGQLKVAAVLHIQIDEEEVRGRLLKRGRQDDYEEAIAERLAEYKEVIRPMLKKMRQADVPVIDINGKQSVDKVHGDIMEALRPLL